MGIGDEAATNLDDQLAATRDLGWGNIEMRGVEIPGHPMANFHDIPDAAFDTALRRFEDAGVQVYCFGSTIMNWARRVDDPFQLTIDEVQRAIPRMQRLDTKYVRIMSFKPGDDEFRIPPEVFRRVKEVTQRFLDAGLQPVHENCMNYGGMSWKHALELLDKCPGLKWVFDTANPIFNPDRSKPKPWPRQEPWEFWTHLRDHTIHIHVKDATWNPAKKDADYNWPGEGEAGVADILKDAKQRGYKAGVSIEPHMVVVFHDANPQKPQDPAAKAAAMRKNFVDYGKALGEMITAI